MKKLVISLVLGASLAIVPSAFALKAMTADNMKDATGQAGVSIAADDVVIFSSASTTSYVDSVNVALGETGEDARFTIAGSESMTTIRAILDDTSRGGYLQYNYATELAEYGIDNGGSTYGNAIEIKPLSIDVSSALTALTAGKTFNYGSQSNIVGVSIGLPTVEIHKPSSTKTYSASASGSLNSGFEYITVEKTAATTAILGGVIEIAPH